MGAGHKLSTGEPEKPLLPKFLAGRSSQYHTLISTSLARLFFPCQPLPPRGHAAGILAQLKPLSSIVLAGSSSRSQSLAPRCRADVVSHRQAPKPLAGALPQSEPRPESRARVSSQRRALPPKSLVGIFVGFDCHASDVFRLHSASRVATDDRLPANECTSGVIRLAGNGPVSCCAIGLVLLARETKSVRECGISLFGVAGDRRSARACVIGAIRHDSCATTVASSSAGVRINGASPEAGAAFPQSKEAA